MNLLKTRISVLPKLKKICHPELDSGSVDEKKSILQIPNQVRNDINSQKSRKLTVGLKKTSFAFIVIASFLLFACSNGTDYVQAKINSLEFTKSQNSNLSANVSGTIDENTKTITVLIPLSSGQDFQTVKSSLKLTNSNVSLGTGTSLVTNLETLNFSTSPVEIVVTTKDETLPYSLIISEKKPTLARNTLAFTEYYNGETYNYKGANKQFIEIYNASSAEIDLGSVQLNRISYEGGVRTRQKDRSVTLSGTLAAKQYLVLTSSKNSDASSWNTSTVKYQTDASYGNIITFNGYDCFTLTSGSTVLDVLGPQNGWPWGNTKHMQRKSSVFSGTYNNRGYQESEWVVKKAENSSNDFSSTVGKATTDPEASDTGITYFELENSSEYYVSDIDNNARTLTLTFYNSSPNYKQYPTISTNGSSVAARINNVWQTVRTGQTELDFSKDIQLRVTSSTASNTLYTIKTVLKPYNMSSSVGGVYKLVTSVSEIQSGDQILVYYPINSETMGSTLDGNNLKGVGSTPDDSGLTYENGMMVLCVTIDEDGNYTFTTNSKFLASRPTGYGFTLDNQPGTLTLWKIRSAGSNTSGTSNCFYIDNVNAAYEGKVQSVNYYSNGFSTFSTGTTDIYKFQIYKKQ